MSDDRTDEQRAADGRLNDAVQAVINAYSYMASGTVLADYVVIGSGIGMTDDGQGTTTGFYALADGGNRLDWHRLMGMIRGATLQIEADYLRTSEED